jgi:hypothetical protein
MDLVILMFCETWSELVRFVVVVIFMFVVVLMFMKNLRDLCFF